MQLIKTTRPALVLEPPPDLTPTLRPAHLEVVAVGIRGVQPYEMLPIQLPHVEIEASFPLSEGVGGRARKDGTQRVAFKGYANSVACTDTFHGIFYGTQTETVYER